MKRKLMNRDEALERQVSEKIENDEYAVGERLPSERALSTQMGVSRGVAREALRRMVRRGRAVVSTRAGYVVAPRKLLLRVNENGSLPSDALQELSWQVEMATSDARPSKLDTAMCERTGFRNGVPVAMEIWQFEGEAAPRLREVCAMGGDVRTIVSPAHETCSVDLYYNVCPWGDGTAAQPMLRHRSEGRAYDGARLFMRMLLLRPCDVCLVWVKGGCGE